MSVVGDAELDEGAIWEALVDPIVPRLGEVLWVVDLNRQSLDRVVPDIAAGRITKMFEAAGWQTITLKYGRRLEELFARDGGEALRRRIDEMPNEEYQRLLGAPEPILRDALARGGAQRLIADVDDGELALSLRDLGGHDLSLLLDAFATADAQKNQPSVIFAYTIKAWRLPTEGHPTNHSSLLTQDQWEQLAGDLGADPADPWAAFAEDSAEASLCAEAAERLRRQPLPPPRPVHPPVELNVRYATRDSTQQAFGRILVELDRQAPEVSARVVTVSPDVASSTNLGGWINRAGVWYPGERIDWFSDDDAMLDQVARNRPRAPHRARYRRGQPRRAPRGARSDLVARRGAAPADRDDLRPIPVACARAVVVRDLRRRPVDSRRHAVRRHTRPGGWRTPVGHDARRSRLEQPGCVSWEPAFAQDLEWTLLHALSRLGRADGESAYFRLTTRPIEQAAAAIPEDGVSRERRRRHVLGGGYRVSGPGGRPDVTLVAVGAVVPEALAAAEHLDGAGVAADLLCLTSPSLVFRALQRSPGSS